MSNVDVLILLECDWENNLATLMSHCRNQSGRVDGSDDQEAKGPLGLLSPETLRKTSW